MTLLRFILFGLALALIQACASTENKVTANLPSSDSSDNSLKRVILQAERDTPDAPTFLLRGTLVLGHETRSFVPCESNRQYWADMPQEMFKQAFGLSREPYQPMYAELIGHIEAASDTGFDTDYTARFVVSGINMVTTENIKRCDQPLKPTRAFGTEPFWSLEYQQESFVLRSPGGQDIVLKILTTNLTPEQRSYSLGKDSPENNPSDDAELSITKSMCSDSMSDSIYGWRSDFTSGENEMQGCAVMSNGDATLKWSGHYIAKSTQTTGFKVALTLFPDHTATTVYSYPEGLPTRESGFWQQLNQDQVQVVMTRHQGQKLIAERIFTLNGNAITTPEEKIGGTVYSIAGGGLTLYRDTH